MANVVIKISADASDAVRKLRIIAKHAAALADELEDDDNAGPEDRPVKKTDVVSLMRGETP